MPVSSRFPAHEKAGQAEHKRTLKKAMTALSHRPTAVENSPPAQPPRILFVPAEPRLLHVLREPALLLEVGDERDGFVIRTSAELDDDIDQRALDILCHPLRIATDVEVRTLGKPRP